MFNASKVASLYVSDRETYDSVSGLMSDDQVAEVLAIVDDRATAAAVERLRKGLREDVSDDEATLLAGDLIRMGEDVLAYGRPLETGGHWTHTVTIPTPYGSVKVQARRA